MAAILSRPQCVITQTQQTQHKVTLHGVIEIISIGGIMQNET